MTCSNRDFRVCSLIGAKEQNDRVGGAAVDCQPATGADALPRAVAEVAKQGFSDSLETPIVKHQLGDSVGVTGAALIGV